MHVRHGLAVGILAWCSLAIAAASAEEAPRVVRLLDRAPGTQRDALIGATQKRTLDALIAANIVPLPAALPAQPVLIVAAGMQPGKESVTVRYEIGWKPAQGDEEQLYSALLSEPGWTPIRIDLTGRNAAGASLIFRRAVTAGPRRDVLRASWGDPVIVSAAKGSAARSVILISLDTLRADHVGLYGHAKARTPTLDALGRRGVWYEHAYSPSGWTLPSHASLFYGQHLAMPAAPIEADASGSGPSSLAEALRAHGFLTAAFTGGGWMSASFNFPNGFDTYYAFPQPTLGQGECPPERFDGKTVFRQATTWLRDHAGGPFFLFMHTYDVHDRCPFQDPAGIGFRPWKIGADPAEMRRFYDALIAKTDGLVGQLVAELQRLGLTRSTTIVITSDHGEFFDEHGLQGHGCVQKPYEELVHVPLIINGPAIAKKSGGIDEPVSLIDVAPTILSLMHLPIPGSMAGTVLPGLGLDAQRRPAPISVVCEDRIMIRDARNKLITSRTAAFRDEVYDLVADPHETKNLASDESRLLPLRRLAASVDGVLPSTPPAGAPAQAVDDSTKERLRALGY